MARTMLGESWRIRLDTSGRYAIPDPSTTRLPIQKVSPVRKQIFATSMTPRPKYE